MSGVNVMRSDDREPGWIARRGLLVLGAAGATVLLAPRAARATGSDLAYRDFLDRAQRLSLLLPAATPAEQDEYVYAAAAMLRRLAAPPTVAFNEAAKVSIRPVDGAKVFSVTLLRAKPGAVLPPHNHPFYSVATMGLAGEVRVRNFEPAGVLPPYASREPFHIRETRAQQLRPGGLSTLAPSRDNLHTFEAGPAGATWMDLSTPHATEGAGDFSYLRLTSGETAAVGDVLEARWGLKD